MIRLIRQSYQNAFLNQRKANKSIKVLKHNLKYLVAIQPRVWAVQESSTRKDRIIKHRYFLQQNQAKDFLKANWLAERHLEVASYPNNIFRMYKYLSLGDTPIGKESEKVGQIDNQILVKLLG